MSVALYCPISLEYIPSPLLDPALDAGLKEWARGFWNAIQPFSTGGVYVNYMDGDEADRIGEAYGSKHYARLAELKKKYDPENLFCLNQNITPAG